VKTVEKVVDRPVNVDVLIEKGIERLVEV